MRYGRSLIVLLVAASVIGCGILPEPPPPYSEEMVIRVWDALDEHYGSEALFECEYLPVVDGRIEIIKPYAVSDITVVAYSPEANETRFFRAVRSNPGENEVVVDGTTLRFNPCRENQNLFVAWIPDLSERWFGKQKEKSGVPK